MGKEKSTRHQRFIDLLNVLESIQRKDMARKNKGDTERGDPWYVEQMTEEIARFEEIIGDIAEERVRKVLSEKK